MHEGKSDLAAAIAGGHPSNTDCFCLNIHQSTDTANCSSICKQWKITSRGIKMRFFKAKGRKYQMTEYWPH